MKYQRHTHGLERRARQLGPVLRGRGRQLGPPHMAEATAGAFENAAAFDDAGDAIALQGFSRRLAPGIGDCARTALTFNGFERIDDARLQINEVTAHAVHGAGTVEGLAHVLLIAR